MNFSIAHEIDSMQFQQFNTSRINARGNNSSLATKKAAKPASSDGCCLCGVNFKISVGDFGGKKAEQVHFDRNSI